jgi:hypothetical protein
MDEKEPPHEPAEDALSAQEAAAIQLTCPVCGGQRFEQIRLFGEKQLFWDTNTPTKLENRIAKFVGAQRVVCYRYRRCDYIVCL